MTNIVILTKSIMKSDYCIARLDEAECSSLLAMHRHSRDVSGECEPHK